jgi:membrane protease YdiL (CAAX protease family)
MANRPSDPRRSRVASLAHGYPFVLFATLALAVSWAAWVPLFVLVPSPTSALMVPGAFGPALAAATVVRLRGESVRAWLTDAVDPHVARRWYLAALGVPLAVALAAGVTFVAVTGRFDPTRLGTATVIYPVALAFATLVGGGQEELGWRGFALPALQERFDAATASVVVGLLWTLWHLPAFVFAVPGYTGSVATYAVLVVGVSVVLTWLYNAADGSVLPAMLLHGGVNAASGLGVAAVGGLPVPLPPKAVLAAAIWLVAVALLARYGRDTLSAATVVTRPGSASDPNTEVSA